MMMVLLLLLLMVVMMMMIIMMMMMMMRMRTIINSDTQKVLLAHSPNLPYSDGIGGSNPTCESYVEVKYKYRENVV